MILYEKTKQEKGYTVEQATSYDCVCVQCDDCKKEYDKRLRDLKSWNGKCASCIGKIRGKMMGDKYGKAQKLQGKCLDCGAPIHQVCKRCIKCDNEFMRKRMTGSNNPAWTGKYVCECGSKKSSSAKRCRKCSFTSGERSGSNNGRYIKENREYFLTCKKARNILSGLTRNVCASGGIQKNYNKTKNLLGYSWEEFKAHMESQFGEEYSWDNYGQDGWSVDHILPVDWFIKNGKFDLRIVNSLKNLRPLWHPDNVRKSKTIIVDDPDFFYEELKRSVYSEVS